MTDISPPALSRSWLPWPLALLLGVLVLAELVLLLSDRGLLLPYYLRAVAYILGSFRPDLLGQGWPVFAAQPFTMFFSYGFLHTGPLHLLGNLVGLVWLGRLCLERRRSVGFLALYLVSSLGAALVFAAFAPPYDTMVGASGALFGLLGALSVENRLVTFERLSLRGRILTVAGLVVFCDLASRLVLGSPVAWQAHLGGFLTGAVFAGIWPVPPLRH